MIPAAPSLPHAIFGRVVSVDFESNEIVLRATTGKLPPLAAGHYMVIRDEDWAAWQNATYAAGKASAIAAVIE